jgi:hypothetical protein
MASGIDRELLRLMTDINHQAFMTFGDRVKTGPFTGMIIPENPPWNDGNASAKLFGTYECVLHEAIEFAIGRRPVAVVNVGCAEGYYAIGLKLRMSDAVVYAFDKKLKSVPTLREYAKRNGAGGIVDVVGCRLPEEMRLPDRQGHRLYVVDCEGDERTLIDVERCPELLFSDLIIECHDFMHEGTSALIADRLAASHRVEFIRPRLPDFEKFPWVWNSPTAVSVLMVLEKRPMPTCWLGCWSKEWGNDDCDLAIKQAHRGA